MQGMIMCMFLAGFAMVGAGALIIWLRLKLDAAQDRIIELEKEHSCAKSDASPRATSERPIGW